MSVKLITFKTNHTIMAEITAGEDCVYLQKAVQVVMQPTKEGPMMGFVPFLDFAEEFKSDPGIKISNADILTINTPVDELYNQYVKAFSGIEIATADVLPR